MATNYVKSWFARGDDDITLVQLIIEKEIGSANLACFHAQQAAEKYFKGFLAHHDLHIRKIHDLEILARDCEKIDSSFAELRNDAGLLSRFYTESRYLDDYIEFSREDATKAFAAALHIKEFVLQKIKPAKFDGGFGLLGIIIAIAAMALVIGGGLYWKELQNQKSLLQNGNDAVKKAEDLKAEIEEQNEPVVDESALPVPGNLTLSFLQGVKPFVQINFDYSVVNNFNIYRSVNATNGWQKIISDFPGSAHTAVDYDYPKDASVLYYRIVSVDERGNESAPSPTASVIVTAQSETSNWKTYRASAEGFEGTSQAVEFKYPVGWNVILSDFASVVIVDPNSPNTNRISFFKWDTDLESSLMDVNSIRTTSPYQFLNMRAKKFVGESGVTGKEVNILVIESRNIYYVIEAPSELFEQVISTFKFIK
jgi:HEPN domain-containing protein